MNLTKMRLFELDNNITESVEIDDSVAQVQDIPVIDTHDGLSDNAENGTPNTKICDPKTDICPSIHMSRTEIEKLEDKIEMDDISINDRIAESYYELNRDLMLAQVQLEAISINTIKKQYEILSESALGTPKYQNDINTLIESSGSNIFMTIINAIKSFINKIKMFITKIISVHLVDYEKWAMANKDKLLSKADKYGSEVTVNIYDWNTKLLFTPINFRQLHSCYTDFIKDTDDKDKMEKAADKLMSTYANITELSNDVYCYTMGLAVGGNPKKMVLKDRKVAMRACYLKYKGEEKVVTMNRERTDKFINKLSKVSKKSTPVMTAIETQCIDPNFNTLLKEVEAEANKKEDNINSIKYRYYKNKFVIMSAVQSACNDICKIQTELINSYSKNLYIALKALNSHAKDVDTTNESIVDIETEIKGYTLHE